MKSFVELMADELEKYKSILKQLLNYLDKDGKLKKIQRSKIF